MNRLRIILLPFSLLYGVIMACRNALFDLGVLAQRKAHIPVVSVGNLSTGGTGKTPHVAYIANALKQEFKLAILMRGYGRSTKGYLRVSAHCKAETVGDEAFYYKSIFGEQLEVIVCENRFEGAQRIREQLPDVNLILLDDAFQHRSIARDCNILIDDYTAPICRDFVLPAGNLREFSCGAKRADIIIVSKCPPTLTSEEIIRQTKWEKSKTLFVSEITYNEILSLGNLKLEFMPEAFLVVTGIGNPKPMLDYCKAFGEVQHVSFPDHHNYTSIDIQRIHEIFDKFAHVNKVIVTTEKDAMRLRNAEIQRLINPYPWCVQRISVNIRKEQNDLIAAIKQKIC
jgi:tetraacyldisaccharide 4'-kinase